jgi:hypothetical protein
MELLGLGQNPLSRHPRSGAAQRSGRSNLDVLPLYIVLLAAFPFVLPASWCAGHGS